MNKEIIDIAEENFKELTTRCIPLSRTSVSSRVFFDWKKKGIIDYPENTSSKRTWVSLNFFEYLWFQICSSLVDFRVSSKLIKEIKKMLFQDIQTLVDQNVLDKRSLQKEIEKQAKRENRKLSRAEIRNIKEGNYSHIKLDLPFRTALGGLFVLMVFKRESPTLYLHMDRDRMLTVDFDLPVTSKKTNKSFKERLREQPLISIPLRPIIESFLSEENNLEHIFQFELINQWEKSVLEVIRSGDFKEIIITKRDNRDIVVKKTQSGEVKGEDVKKVKKLLGLKDYKKVTITHRNDKHFYVENTIIEDI